MTSYRRCGDFCKPPDCSKPLRKGRPKVSAAAAWPRHCRKRAVRASRAHRAWSPPVRPGMDGSTAVDCREPRCPPPRRRLDAIGSHVVTRPTPSDPATSKWRLIAQHGDAGCSHADALKPNKKKAVAHRLDTAPAPRGARTPGRRGRLAGSSPELFDRSTECSDLRSAHPAGSSRAAPGQAGVSLSARPAGEGRGRSRGALCSSVPSVFWPRSQRGVREDGSPAGLWARLSRGRKKSASTAAHLELEARRQALAGQ